MSALLAATGVAAATGGVVLRTKLIRRTVVWVATVYAVLDYVAVIFVAAVVLPGIDEVPPDCPAVVQWHFRLASTRLQLVMWSTFGVTFGWPPISCLHRR